MGTGDEEEEETVDMEYGRGNWVGEDVRVAFGCGGLWTSSLRSLPVPLLLLLDILERVDILPLEPQKVLCVDEIHV